MTDAPDVQAYASNGYLIFDPKTPLSLIRAVHTDVHALLDKRADALRLGGKDRSGVNGYRETESDLHLKSESVRELISHDAFHALAMALLGPDLDLRFCTTMTKTAASGEPLGWHQDWGLDRDSGHPRISLWIAVTDADIENGCVWVIPGSHREEILAHSVSETHPPDMGIKEVDAAGAIPIALQAGQALVIHPKLIHGSGKNISGRERMALLPSFQVPKPGYDAFWAAAGMRYSIGGKKVWEPLRANA
jgi:ectoine hydroxylase-related dioxygenase (phytanoyl-CoA dioxygenase family)